MADRTVRYLLRVEEDAGNQQRLSKYSASILATEKKLADQRRKISKDTLDTMRKQGQTYLQGVERQMTRSVKAYETAATKAAKQAADAHQKASRSIAESNRRSIGSIEQSASRASTAVTNASRQSSDAARKAIEEHNQKVGQLRMEYQEAGRELRGRFEEWAGGVMQLGRGVAELGLLSAESTEELVRGLVAAQGVFDTVIGGVKTFQELKRVVDQYKIAQAAAAAATQATSRSNVAAITAETTATNALAAARGRAAAAGKASGASGAATGLGSRIGRGVGRVGSAIGGGVAAGAGRVAGGLGLGGVGGGAMAVAGAGLSALAGAAFGATGAISSLRAAAENGVGGGAGPGTFADTVGGSNFNPFSWLIAWSDKMDAMASEALTERRQIELEFNKIAHQRNRDYARIASEEQAALLGARLTGMGAGPGATASEQLAANRRRLATVRSSRGGILEAAGRSTDLDEAQAAVDLQNQELDLLREQRQIQKQIFDDKKEAARVARESAEQELQAAKQAAAVDRERLMSAKERFGQLSQLEQQRLIAIKKRADAGEELSRKERGLLRSVGTEQAVDIARQGDLAAAEAAGFGDVFGQAERDRLAQREAEIQELRLKVTEATKIEVDVQVEADRVEQSVREAIREQTQALVPLLQRVAREEAANAVNEVRKSAEQRENALRAAQGNS